MLEEIRIRGLGVIDDATLPLGPGLTVVTGETGAGKTMVVTGLLLLFGGRADATRVRVGAEQASVEGRLELAAGTPAAQRVLDAGGELDDGTGLVLRRVVTAAGRSRGYVGGTAAPIGVLAELADALLAVHGQSDQLRLTRPAEQRAALDRFAGVDLTEFGAAFTGWRELDARLRERTEHLAELRQQAELLAAGLAEIEAADPQPGEDAELAALASRLGAADALRLAAHAAHDALLGDSEAPLADAPTVTGLLADASRAVGQLSGADAELDALGSRLGELDALAAELGADFGRYVDELDADPQRLEQVEARRAVLAGLLRKYAPAPGSGVSDVLDWARRAAQRLAELDVSDEALAELAQRRDAAEVRVVELATDLSRRRAAAARKLTEAVDTELAGLAMPDARVQISLTRRRPAATGAALRIDDDTVGVSADGIDDVEFLLQPNPHAAALPLGRTASGGELSRIMLAIELCTVGADRAGVATGPPTLVFDEVDAGIGGRAATEVGRRLAALARERQVLVVTHLAQVAAFADRHVVVDKPNSVTKRTAAPGGAARIVASDVRAVAGDDRVAELARMLAGTETASARRAAADLLRAAQAR